MNPILIAMPLAVLAALPATAAVFLEELSADPGQTGWSLHGESSLFSWDSQQGNLRVTWDSSKPNSYFYKKLPVVLARDSDFSFEFDLRLIEIQSGVAADRPYTFQIAAGMLHLETATQDNFVRGTGTGSANLAEFNYFPGTGLIAPTVSPVIISASGRFFPSFTFPAELVPERTYTISMRFDSADQTLHTEILEDGQAFTAIKPVVYPASASDFRLDAFAVASYSDAGSGGSLFARGTIDRIRLEVPPAPVDHLQITQRAGALRLSFDAVPGWLYKIQTSDDLSAWSDAGQLEAPDAGTLEFEVEAPANPSFFRVRADRPPVE